MAAIAALLVACATILSTTTLRVDHGDGSTYVVIEFRETRPISLDASDNPGGVISRQVYQVTTDGRYRHLGAWHPLTNENLYAGRAGLGVYSEADRALVSQVLGQDGNYITEGSNNVTDIETAVTVMTGSAPQKVDSPGSLIFPGTAARPAPEPTPASSVDSGASDAGAGLDDSQGE